MKSKFALFAALPTVALLFACSQATPISTEEASNRFTAIADAYESDEVIDKYEDVKVVETTTEGENSIVSTVIYSVPNKYYSMESDGEFFGVYEIDGTMTVVSSIDDGEATTTRSSTEEAEVAFYTSLINAAVTGLSEEMMEIAWMAIEAAVAYESNSSNEEEVTFAFSSKGEGSLIVSMSSEEGKYEVTIENNLVISGHSESVDYIDVTGAGTTSISDVSFSYGVSSNDCKKIIP